jgi:excisionase family DNA binding protein
LGKKAAEARERVMSNIGQHKKFSTIETAKMLGVAVSSVSKWIDEGVLVAGRTPGGHRRIEREDLVKFLHQQKLRIPKELRTSPTKILIVDDEKPLAEWLSEEIRGRYPEFEVVVAQYGFSV